jgi:hypothetical protein
MGCDQIPDYALHNQPVRNVRFVVFTAVTMKNGVFWDVPRVALVRTDVSEELSESFIRVTRIGEHNIT